MNDIATPHPERKKGRRKARPLDAVRLAEARRRELELRHEENLNLFRGAVRVERRNLVEVPSTPGFSGESVSSLDESLEASRFQARKATALANLGATRVRLGLTVQEANAVLSDELGPIGELD